VSDIVVAVEKIDEVFMRIRAEASVLRELAEFFCFRPTGYQYNPKFKAKMWDGFVRLMTPFKPRLYIGLLEHLRKFCEIREYQLVVAADLQDETDVPDDYGYRLAEQVGCKLELRDYQNSYVVNSIRRKRVLNLSPTSSGKSLMIYLIIQHYLQSYRHRTLLIVPTINLVHQMASDLVSYGCDPALIYKIQGGVDKQTNAKIVISTWQSLSSQPSEWMNQFGVLIGDEAHLFTGKSLVNIMESNQTAQYRFGFTGTLDSDSKTHEMVLQGLFGTVKRFVTTKQLIDAGSVATFNVRALVLQYPDEVKQPFRKQITKLAKEKRFAAERSFIINNQRRNLFIRNLVWSLEDQNNLILFERVETHGKVLEPLLRKEGRVLHFIHGGVSGEERERIRHEVENDTVKRHDILASFGTFSTGTSIKRIDNAIFCSAYKSDIKTLQSIGRTLRIGNGSDKATLYDIADDLSLGSYSNYTLDHFKHRIETYSAEQFPFKIHNVPISAD
jgi:superfamily II DNA or RNA helicase